MIRFSLLLASRHRRELLLTLLDSIKNTASSPEKIEILVGIDSDDTKTYEGIVFENLKFFVRDRSEWMHRDYINWLYQKSKGKYIIVLNDDTMFKNRNWDDLAWQKLEEYLQDKPDGCAYCFTSTHSGSPTLCTFPLLSRKAIDAVGFVMPNERKNWGADHDLYNIYTHPLVNRKLDLPEIQIQHVSHHTGLRARDELNLEIEKVFMTQSNIYIPTDAYAERLHNYISSVRSSKILAVYNICGISGKENIDYYTAAINSILNQEFDDGFHVVVSACQSSKQVRDTLTHCFGNLVSYNWIDEKLPLCVTFNHTVKKCVREFGAFEAYLYVDSGVSFSTRRDVIKCLVELMRKDNYAMVSARVDVDSGYKGWGINLDESDYVISVGQACNLHCQLFSHDLYQAYNEKILPDIFAQHTSESVYSFLCAAIQRRWAISSKFILHHETSMDGASSGFMRSGLLFRSPKTIERICAEGKPLGFGYEEISKICMHDKSKFDDKGNALDPNLYTFIKDNLYLSDSFDNVQHEFIPTRKTHVVSLPSPQISCILVSHNKPSYVKEAIQSVLDQTLQDWELVIIDSGILYHQGFFNYLSDPRVRVIFSDETAETRKTKAMAPFCFNKVFREGLIKGFAILYLCDDDKWYNNAFETFTNFYRHNPYVQACYASQDLVTILKDGTRLHSGERRALTKRGQCVGGEPLDCQVDYLQFCHRRDITNLIKDSEFWPESKSMETHSDGIFMEKIGRLVPIYGIDIKVGVNQRTPLSTYVPVR